MGLLTIFEQGKRAMGGLDTRSVVGDAIAEYSASGDFQPREVKDLAGASAYHPTVYACVHAIAQWCSTVPILITRQGKKIPREELHWMVELFRRPNTQDSPVDLIYALVHNLMVVGNAPMEIVLEKAGRKTYIPSELWVVRPEHLKRIYTVADGGRLYEFQVGNEQLYLDDDSCLHFRTYNPKNDLWGLAPLASLKSNLQSDLRAFNYNNLFFENGAIPGGVITSDQYLTREAAKDLRDSWAASHKGDTKSHTVAVLGRGAKYQAVGASHSDMGFVDLLRYSAKQIQRVFRVPDIVLGDTQNANRSTAKEERQIFYKDVVIPVLKNLQSKLNHSFVQKYDFQNEDLELVFNVNAVDAMLDTLLEKAKTANALAFQGGGWTPNRVLAEFWGFETITDNPAADMVHIPAGSIPLGVVNQSVMGTDPKPLPEGDAPAKAAPEPAKPKPDVGENDTPQEDEDADAE